MPVPHDPTPNDDHLLDELRGMFGRADPVPDAVLAAAHAAIELRDLDLQIAELLMDSAVEDKELAGVRGGATRLLTFSVGEDRFVEVDVASDGDSRSLHGYVVPGVAGELLIDHSGGSEVAAVDEHGRFSVPRIAAGLVRLRFTLGGLRPLATAWVPV